MATQGLARCRPWTRLAGVCERMDVVEEKGDASMMTSSCWTGRWRRTEGEWSLFVVRLKS